MTHPLIISRDHGNISSDEKLKFTYFLSSVLTGWQEDGWQTTGSAKVPEKGDCRRGGSLTYRSGDTKTLAAASKQKPSPRCVSRLLSPRSLSLCQPLLQLAQHPPRPATLDTAHAHSSAASLARAGRRRRMCRWSDARAGSGQCAAGRVTLCGSHPGCCMPCMLCPVSRH